jgi:hypothetical protein
MNRQKRYRLRHPDYTSYKPRPQALRVTVTVAPNVYLKVSEKDRRGGKRPNAGRKG